MTIRGKLKRFYQFMQTKRAGETVSKAEVLQHSGWSASTFDTYWDKNHLGPFLSATSGGLYRVLRDGHTITESEVKQAFTQVRPGRLVLTKGIELRGSADIYELLHHIGNGAVAHVWEVLSRKTEQKHAAKIMNPREDLLEPTTLENVARRFAREARNGQKLMHPNVVRYLDYGDLNEHPFLIMSLADRSIAQTVKERAFSANESVNIVRECLAGLHYLHSERCIHRDIKPDNILQFGERILLGDLGIVRWPELNPAFISAGTITRNSVQLGSWHYMAPEQRQAPHEATEASDVYALGVTWYEMLTQITPDPAAAGAGAFPPAPVQAEINDLIKQMLSYEPRRRPSVGELIMRTERIAPASPS